jgi:hypothetical protein
VTGEAALQVGVVEQRLDLQANASDGQAWLELRQPHALAGGLGTVEGEAENADHSNPSSPEENRTILGDALCVLVFARAGAGARKERIDFGVELVEPRGFALELLHPLLVCDLPPLFFDPQLLALVLQVLHSQLVFDFIQIELDLSQLVVGDGLTNGAETSIYMAFFGDLH